MGAAGGESCSVKNGGPSNVKVELVSPSGDLVSSVLTSPSGSYLFTNLIPGREVYVYRETLLNSITCTILEIITKSNISNCPRFMYIIFM